MQTSDSFYERLSPTEVFATEHTRGPWSPDHQHGGPPTALLGGVIEDHLSSDWLLTRVTFDFLRPVPLGHLEIDFEPGRRGRRVCRPMVALRANGRSVLLARGLAVKHRYLDSSAWADCKTSKVVLPSPMDTPSYSFPIPLNAVGYHTSIELRMAEGGVGRGFANCWLRPRFGLFQERTLSPIQRMLVIADAASGISAALDMRKYSFANSDLTVAVSRPPVGEWIGLVASSDPSDSGVGLARSRLYDERGCFGTSAQVLVMSQR